MLEYRSYWRVHRPSAWSKAPTEMTVSALRDIEACPRRWALNAATYDGLWQGRGYPPRLRLGSLSGSVIHLALETVLDALATSSCGSITDPAAVNVLKSLGGYTKVLNDCITRVLSAFSGNPRAVRLLEAGDRSLRSQLPKLRTATQTLVGRVRLSARARPTGFATSERPPTSLPEGTHLELVLRAPNMGWKGKADLLTCSRYSCEIVDFKTGVADDSHRFQLQVYAVLWSRDQNLNPNGRLATQLTLAYPTGDVDVAVPSPPAFAALERDLFARVRAVALGLTVVLTTGCWSDIAGLVWLDLSGYDRNVLIDVHTYRPFSFTHQGADWTLPGLRTMAGLSFPAARTDRAVAEAASARLLLSLSPDGSDLATLLDPSERAAAIAAGLAVLWLI